MPLSYDGFALTHVGNVRDINEDAFCINDSKMIWCLADGMGGHEAGDLASAMVVKAIESVAMESSITQVADSIRTAIEGVNARLLKLGKGGHRGISGSTVVAFAARAQEGVCLWAGDSRLYLFRQQQLYQLSKDHSVVQDWVDKGFISAEDAHKHPQSNIITRAVGVEPILELDLIQFQLFDGDCLLLCSDGLHGELSSQQIFSILCAGGDSECLARRFIEATLAGAARDNITVSVIKVVER